jgi:O-antigen/teichoic acid export membrane protein
MSLLIKASKQSSLYMIFHGVGLGISFISFPIMTRMFSVEDYGNLALVNATLVIMIGLAKCGITTSFIRHYPEFISEDKKQLLYSSALSGSVLIPLVIIICYSIAIFFLNENIGVYLTKTFLIVGLIILFRTLESLFSSFFRAEERVITLNIVSLLYKTGSLISGILAFFILIKGLHGYFIGVVIFEAFMTAVLIIGYYRKGLLQIKTISLNTFKMLYVYGFPLVFLEVSSLINDYSDRFLIKYFLDSTQLGIYSVGYNLSMYIQGFITAPLWMAVFPIYTKLWEAEGRKETEKFLSQLLKYYLCIAILVLFGISLLSEELITILATKKYSSASQIIPLVAGSILIYGVSHIIGAGFHLMKQTKKIALYTVIVACLNFILNLYLIPKYNIMGAAYSTVASYILLTILIAINSNKLLKVAWPIQDIIFYIFFSIISMMVLNQINIENKFLNLFSKSLIGLLTYSIFIIIYDKKIKRLFFSYIYSAVERK